MPGLRIAPFRRWLAGACLAAAACSGGSPNPLPRAAPAGPRLFVSNEIDGTVSEIDVDRRSLVRTIPVGKRPRGIRASSDGGKVFVALSGSPMGGPGTDESQLPPPDRRHDGIGVIDVTSGALERILPGGDDPEHFAVTRDGRQLCIANEDAGTVTVVDIASGRIVKSIKVGGEPEGVDLSPDGRFMYVTSEADNRVFVIDTASLTVVKEIDVGARPRATAFSVRAPRAYVSAENESRVYVIDTDRRIAEGRIEIPGAGAKPMGVVASPDGRFVYVTTGRGRTVVKIDAAANTIVGAPLDVGERPWGIAISADGQTLYTANGPSNDVSFVDTGRWVVVARVKVGERPWGVAVRQ